MRLTQAKTITNYDSLSHLSQVRLDKVLQFLRDEYEANQCMFQDTEWTTVDSGRKFCPWQENGSDCGVFTCIRADYAALGLVPDYTQADIPFFRRRMCLSILSDTMI